MSHTISRKILYKKKRYGIFHCYRCGAWNLSNMFQNTHHCPECHKVLLISKVNVAFGFDDLIKGMEYFRKLKMPKVAKPDFVTADEL